MPARPDDSGHSGGGSGVTTSLEAPRTFLSKYKETFTRITCCFSSMWGGLPARNATPASNVKRSSSDWHSVAGGPSKCVVFVYGCMYHKHSSLLTVLTPSDRSDKTR